MQLQSQLSLNQASPNMCLIVGVFENLQFTPLGKTLNEQSQKVLEKLVINQQLGNTLGDTLYLPQLQGTDASVLLVYSGKSDDITETAFQKILKKSLPTLSKVKAETFYCELTDLPVKNVDKPWKALQATAILTNVFYRFDFYKSEENMTANKTIILQTDEAALTYANALLEGITLVKNLANQPSNICTPTYLANKAIEVGQKYSQLSTEVLDEDKMRELGMNTLLSVSKGSKEPAKLICLNYQGSKSQQKPFVFIGKGITFDTGGISIKSSAAMDEMKYDMCGGATVIGLIQTIAQCQLPINVIGLVPTSENMPGGNATKPGDIVKSMSGKSVEILNTDAEGRLILCDTLTYAEKFNPEFVVDIATLTGSIARTFGHVASAVMGNNAPLIQELISASKTAGDRLWELPLWEEYQEMLSSNFADLPNIHADALAGGIVAGCFLSRFAEKFPWAHLDIAGTAYVSGKEKGATARPLPLLMTFLLEKAKGQS